MTRGTTDNGRHLVNGTRRPSSLLAVLLLFACCMTAAAADSTTTTATQQQESPQNTCGEQEEECPQNSTGEQEDDSDFENPTLKPWEMSPFFWDEDGEQVDEYARMIGLDPKLTQEIRDYCERVGLIDLFWKLSYESSLKPKQLELYTLKDGTKWTGMGPGWSNGLKKTNMHWVDPGDEEAYETTLDVLKRGGIDHVFDKIGNEFQLDGLMVYGMGFIVVTKHSGDNMHADLPGEAGRFFDLLFPLILPEDDVAQLYIGDLDEEAVGAINYQPNVGILVGGETLHGTGAADYTESRGLRVAVSLYLADVNEDNLEVIADEGSSVFPVREDEEWVFAQKGRVWGGGNSLMNDKGRKPYTAEDDDDDCPALAAKGKCETDLRGVRFRCLKSCNIYIDDERYFSEYFSSAE